MKVLLEGPVLTNSGYGEHCRLVFRSIKDLPGIELSINPLNWGMTSWGSELSSERVEIDQCVRKYSEEVQSAQNTQTPINYAIQIHVGILSEFEKKAPYSVCVTAGIETDRVSPNWLSKTHQGVDKIIVPSEHSKSGFVNTKFEIRNDSKKQVTILDLGCPIDVVPYPIKTTKEERLNLSLNTDFNFLSVALLGVRKNLENLVRWFLEEFEHDNVGLILKTSQGRGSIIDRDNTFKYLKNIIDSKDRKCKVFLLHGDLSEAELHSLFNNEQIQAYVTCTHGEGYGLPIFEAAYSGLPIIATDWSGHLDFLSCEYKQNGKAKNKKLFAKVDYSLEEIPSEAVWENILIEGSKWAVPKEHALKRQMRNVFDKYGMYKKWATALKESVPTSHTEEAIFEKMQKSLFPPEILEKLQNTKEDFFWFEEQQIKTYD